MCGLAALFAPTGDGLAEEIRAMTAAVRHRGPDDEGYVLLSEHRSPAVLGGVDTPTDGFKPRFGYSPRGLVESVTGEWQVALGHRRLSIVDLSPAGHQPMSSADGALWIVYNGEIYNHIELRAALEAEGVRFATRSDTEVILAAYRRWGEKCLERFNGMFAFVLVDWRRRHAFAARDRFGVKPLYYWRSSSGTLAFASEIKQFTVLPGWKAALNGQRAYDFINWGVFDHTEETLFNGVKQLRGGELMSAGLEELVKGMPVRRWYTLTPRIINEADPAAAYRELFEDSVRLRLRADVPVGSCLSGGLDSSSIVCVANRQLRAAGAEDVQRTFSARSSDPRVDEGKFIETVVRHTGVANAQVDPPRNALFRELPALTWHQDEPFGSTSIYAQWHVFRLAAAHGVKVMLDGQGADEQLAGYASFFSARFSSLLRQGRLADFVRETRAVGANHRLPPRDLAARAASLVLPEVVRRPLRRIRRRAATLGEDWIDLARLRASARNPELALGGVPTNVLEMSVSQIVHTSLPMLLHWEDRDSMAQSIEARVPFLDYRLVELTLGLPEEQKLALGVTKRVLRDAMRGILPEEIRNRSDKIGFATAEEQWLRAGCPDAFRTAMREAVEASHGMLRPQACAMLEDFIAGRRPFNFLPWRVISFGAWMRRFDVQPG
jgi:asparagine synthase (glutamine-hydrolysing)